MLEPNPDDLIAHLLSLGDRQPTAPALMAPGRRAMTFGELAARTRAVGEALARWGIQRGDVVAWPMGDRAEGALALAMMPVSCTLAPLAPAPNEEAGVSLLRRLRAKAVAVRAGSDGALVAAGRRLGLAEVSIDPDPDGAAGAVALALSSPPHVVDPARSVDPRIAYLTVTSGTTGRAKIVPHGHRQLMALSRLMADRLAIIPGDISAHLAPMHLANGLRTAHLLALFGGATVSCLAEADTDAFLAAMDRGEVTYASVSFTICRELLARHDSGRRCTAGCLRFLRVASGRLENDEIARLEDALGAPVIAGLATSETGNITHQRLPPMERARGSVGPPLGCEIRLVDVDGRIVTRGGTGEIQVRGPQVFDGYLDDPDLSSTAFVDGWFRTGDLGRFDDAGELHLAGRIKEIVNRGGDKISPIEVDAALRSVTGVADAAAFGVAHPRLGEELVAAVVRQPHAGIEAQEVIARVRELLGSRRTPRRVWFVDSLPRNASGKLLRHMLTGLVSGDGAQMARSADDASDGVWPARAGGRRTARPLSPLQLALTALWARALRRSDFDPDDDFFLLGGDSLCGAQLLDQVQECFGVRLPLNALFTDAGTVATMALRIAEARSLAPSGPALPHIAHRASDAPVALSSTQARAWFLHRLDPASDAYHEARLWRIEGPLDVDAFRVALRAVAVRQPMLRTRFLCGNNGPVQVIDAEPVVVLERVALAGDPAEMERCLESAVREHASRPFDLAAGTPLRWTLFELGSERHALLRVWHHILGDAISAEILQRELSAAYSAVRAGRDPAMPALVVDYADFATWQAGDLDGTKLERLLGAWKTRLAHVPTLPLPTDFRRPPTMSFRGAVVKDRLSCRSVEELESLGRTLGATPFVTLLAAFQALLARLSGADDFAVGTPVAGRVLPELQPIIGFFANTLVIRADLSGAPDTFELVRRVRERVREALELQQMPFERLVEGLGVPRDPSRNPLFQVAFAMRNEASEGLELEGALVRRVETGIGRAKFDLALSVSRTPGGADMRWEYCSDLFEHAAVLRMSRQFATLVEAMSLDPDRPIGELAMADAEAQTRTVAGLDGVASDYASDAPVHHRFARLAQGGPEALAVGMVRYGELETESNRLARALRAAGVVRGARVAVARTCAASVAIAWLAVLKCGAAYVPLDGELPAARLDFIIADAEVRHAILDAGVAQRLAGAGLHCVFPDEDAERIAAYDATPLPDETVADDPAYVMYTSGSTGRPKGVVVPHRAVLRLVCNSDYVRLGPSDVVAQLANTAFDASTFEFWGPLLNGGQVLPIAKATALAPRALASEIARHRVTSLFLTTALFNAVARDVPDAFHTCRDVLFGGEIVEPVWVRAVLAAGPPKRLLHVYGPTEATTFATWHEVRDVPPNATTVPIGRPIANTSVRVLRADLRPAAVGEPGDLVIGGPGVALGYLGQPDATSERFVDGPKIGLPKGVWYRTGDRVRLRDDGAIEFLGRLDRQVKVRGHRVELDEVETILKQVPSVADAAVTIRGDTTETRQIVAHLVRADRAAPPPTNLYSELRRLLPEYMVPGLIVWLTTLPLNASGKVDRRALEESAVTASARSAKHTPPRDMLEQLVVRVWEEVLGVSGIGVFDHFFDIGGHSLLAIRLIDAIERETGLSLPLTAMFTDDTPAALAAAVRNAAPIGSAPILLLNPGGEALPLVFLHGDFVGGGYYSRALAQALAPQHPVFVVHPHGLAESSVPPNIEAMAAERVASLRAMRPHGPFIVGGHCNGAFVAFEMARQLAEAGEDVPAVIVIEARAPQGGAVGPADAWATIDGAGVPRIIAARDLHTDLWLRYLRAMHAYAGHHFPGRLIVVRSQSLADARMDLGWSRFAARTEVHRLPGNHVTVVTGHVSELAAVIRRTMARAPHGGPA